MHPSGEGEDRSQGEITKNSNIILHRLCMVSLKSMVSLKKHTVNSNVQPYAPHTLTTRYLLGEHDPASGQLLIDTYTFPTVRARLGGM